jgi:hypothetical protein
MGFDVDGICVAVEGARAALLRRGPTDVVYDPGEAPVFRCDVAALPAEARHWRAWGFDAAGNALEMEITVPD